MAINKEKLMEVLTVEQIEEVKKLEHVIDDMLRNYFVPGDLVTVHLYKQPHGRVRLELIRLYREQGWQITFRQDRGIHIIELS